MNANRIVKKRLALVFRDPSETPHRKGILLIY